MNSLTNNTHWLKVIALLGIALLASLPARAADRNDVVAGVIIGTAAGYILSEHGANLRIAYRSGDHRHHHHSRDCYHDRHHPKYDRHYNSHYNSHHGKSHYGKSHHGYHAHGYGDKHGHKYKDRHYQSAQGHHGGSKHDRHVKYDRYDKHHRPVASKPQRHQEYSHKERRMVSSRY